MLKIRHHGDVLLIIGFKEETTKKLKCQLATVSAETRTKSTYRSPNQMRPTLNLTCFTQGIKV